MCRLFVMALVLALLCVGASAESLMEKNMRLKERAQTIAGWIYAGDFEAVEAEFSQYMVSMADAQMLAESWGEIQSHLGAFVKRKNAVCNIVDGYADVTIRDAFENYTLELGIVFDSEERIYGISMRVPELVSSGEHAAEVPDRETAQLLLEESVTLSDALLAGDYGAIVNRLSAEIIGSMDETTIAKGWEQLAPALGEYVQRGEIHAGMSGNYLVVVIQEEFSQKTLEVQFVWDGRKELLGFHFNAAFGMDELP